MRLLEENFVKAVAPHLKNGFFHVSAVCNTLLHFENSNESTFKADIHKAVTILNELETVAKSHLDRVDEYTEELTQSKGKLNSKYHSLQNNVANLQTECRAIEDNMSDYKYALQKAKNDKKSAKRHLEHCRTVRDVGIGLMIITHFGTLAGKRCESFSTTSVINTLLND